MLFDLTRKLFPFPFYSFFFRPGENYTDYVATRWYRAPELVSYKLRFSLSILLTWKIYLHVNY